MKVFNKDGKQIDPSAIISRYLFDCANRLNKDVEDIFVGIELSHPIRDDGKNTLQIVDLDLNTLDEVLSENGLDL